MRELGAQAVAWLGGFSEAAAELIGKNQVILRGVEQLAGAEQHAAEGGDEKNFAGAVRAVKNQDGVCDAAARIALRRADGCVVQADLRQRLAVGKFEVTRDVVAFLRLNGGERSILLREAE